MFHKSTKTFINCYYIWIFFVWRRVKRGYDEDVPPDYNENPLSSQVHFCAYYFKNYVWKEAFLHPEYRLPSNWKKPLFQLSATAPLEENYEATSNFVANF